LSELLFCVRLCVDKEKCTAYWRPQYSKVSSLVRPLSADGYPCPHPWRVTWYPTLPGYPLSYPIGYPGSVLPGYGSPSSNTPGR